MDSINLDPLEKSSPEMSSDSSLSDDSPETSGIYGEPLMHPRVGNEYQAEIPSLLSESEFLQDINGPSFDFSVGPAIPVIWVSNRPTRVKDEKSESVEVGPTVETESHFIVPGVLTESWGGFEVDWFVLGLYFFGKNLGEVSRFMDGKTMGAILSFYYGQFYGSPAYRKWSHCRKMRNKKCVVGARFFTGYRQQELFSRLFPHISDESRTNLLEASREFADGKQSLEEYVSTLKATVGIHVLVEAVSIGKGKDDLTTLVIDTSKNNQLPPNRPEIPSGKACSSLTCTEIVKFLTGDYRLSKARSNDLFWEAVWPRLLARGWHSEQPWGDAYPMSKNSLVFLMPGIKKFSRRKLTKGEHYFDSVSDVLAKVASEPELLELDETQLSISKEKNGWAHTNVGVDNGQGHDSQERRCYLKPRVSIGSLNIRKFTVVDTSLGNEENNYKVRELKSLPFEGKKTSKISHRSRKSGVENGESRRNDGKNELNPLNLPSEFKPKAIKLKFTHLGSGLSSCMVQEPKRRKADWGQGGPPFVLCLPSKQKKGAYKGVVKDSVPTQKGQVSSDESCSGNCVDGGFLPGKEVKLEAREVIDLNLPHVSEIDDGKVKVKQEENDVRTDFDDVKLDDALKFKDTTECSDVVRSDDVLKSKGTTEFSDVLRSDDVFKSKDTTECSDVVRSDDVLKSKDTTECSDVVKLDDALESKDTTECSDVVKLDDVLKSKDTTECSDAVKLDDDVLKSKDTTECSDADKPKVEDGQSEVKVKVEDGQSEVKLHSLLLGPEDGGTHQESRRKSTRNRPLTTKALEALEIGFLKPVGTYRKRSQSTSQEDQKSKRSRRSTHKTGLTPNTVIQETDGTHDEKPQIVGDPHIGSIAVKKEATSSNHLEVPELSCSECSEVP